MTDPDALNRRCVELFYHPRVQLSLWSAGLFWILDQDVVQPDDLTRPKVDLEELEVMLAATARVPSECAESLDGRRPGRADFIRRAAHRGERPLLSRPG